MTEDCVGTAAFGRAGERISLADFEIHGAARRDLLTGRGNLRHNHARSVRLGDRRRLNWHGLRFAGQWWW